jgi:prepilin-type N-terminal cleavage/methylation domain-containing protein
MSAPRPARLRSAGGFTLLEVMLTLVILSFGLLTLGLMQLYAMREGAQGRHTGDGTAIARSYLEQATRLPWSVLTTAEAAGDWVAPDPEDWTGQPLAQTLVDAPTGAPMAEHTYTIQWRVTDIGAGPDVCLRDVEVSVSWNEEGRSTPKTHVIGTRRFNAGDPAC